MDFTAWVLFVGLSVLPISRTQEHFVRSPIANMEEEPGGSTSPTVKHRMNTGLRRTDARNMEDYTILYVMKDTTHSDVVYVHPIAQQE